MKGVQDNWRKYSYRENSFYGYWRVGRPDDGERLSIASKKIAGLPAEENKPCRKSPSLNRMNEKSIKLLYQTYACEVNNNSG